jgi:AAHS family benzoate transporter-like MFS transporter
VLWVVSLATVGLIFDGYDLVAYGAVVPTFLKDPSQLGEVTPAVAGTLGSYALLGMLFGALLAGAVGDIVGRRRVMLTAYAWFSLGMAITAFTSTTTTFGIFRFVTGLGMGALIVASRVSRPTATGTHRMAALEGVASFWHLVDLLWIMLFATLYLVR